MNNLFRQLIYGIDSYTIQQKNLLKNINDNYIKYMYIGRKPIQSEIKFTLNILSKGRFLENLKKSDYDDIYHLYMIIILDNNYNILIEKNERINIKVLYLNDFKNYFNKPKIEILLNEPIKINQLLNNTQQLMGKSFFIYDSRNYNCQNFIINILKSNNLYNDKYYKFIYQNPLYLYDNLDYLGNFAKNITDIGAKINLIKSGGFVKIYDDDNNIIKFQIDDEIDHNFVKIDDDYIMFFKKKSY